METRIYVSRKDLYHWKEKLEMIMIMAINLSYIRQYNSDSYRSQ